ncbi:type IV pilus biogenesis protein PilM [Terriglobus sp.]|uniref:type IV pilus biogenesis protein PilM n=1 Tax=Terriglobus sp. TaxID=1889013 RepID=UPI003B001DC8
MPSLIPKSSYEARPRIAVEIRPEGVFAARANDASGFMAQVARAELPRQAVQPGLRQQNITDPQRVAAAVRQVLGQLQQGKLRDVTLIVPDAAVRVILLDFDSLPSDTDDALAVVRFRLAKLLPFPTDAAQISYQVMTERARQLQVLTVAIPYAVLAEYEAAVRDAGFEPGAVLPSTLAVASAVNDAAPGASGTAALVINTSADTMTTAILRRGELLLHRMLETAPAALAPAAQLPAASSIAVVPTMPVDGMYAAVEPREYGADDLAGSDVDEGPVVESFVPARELAEAEATATALEMQRAVAVAAAYYEDSLAAPPELVLTSGSMSALQVAVLLEGSGLQTRELMQAGDLLGTVTTPMPYGLLAGLRGALRNDARIVTRPGARVGARP